MYNEKMNKANVQDILPLSSIQEGMLYNYIKNENSKRYHQQLLLEIGGELDVSCFQAASDILAEKNEILRTLFKWKGLKQPLQVILKKNKTKLYYYDCSDKSDIEYISLVESNSFHNQILNEEVPFYMYVYKKNNGEYAIQIVYHHIILDGWSNASMLKQLFHYYKQIKNNIEIDPFVIGRMKDYMNYLIKQDKRKQEEFWKDYFAGMDAISELYIHRGSKNQQNKEVNINHIALISNELKLDIQKYANANNITYAVLFYVAWGILLRKYTDMDDVVFGRVLAGRPSEISHINELLGLFINTIPVRFNYKGNMKMLELLPEMQNSLRKTDEFQYTSLTDIKRYRGLESTSSLFDTLVVIENYKIDKSLQKKDKDGFIKKYSMTESTEYPLTLKVNMLEQWEINLQYDGALFDEMYISSMVGHFLNILKQVVHNKDITLADIDIMGDDEKSKIISVGTGAKYPVYNYNTLKYAIEKQAEISPDKILLQDKDKKMTYKEVNRRCNKMARKLIDMGACRNRIVAVMLDRSIEMYLAIIAVIKSGAAYLPINVNNPEQRVNDIIKDSGSLCIITTDKYFPIINKEFSIVEVNELVKLGEQDENPDIELTGDDLAYVIYTSGSTGRPKGVMIGHLAIYNRISWMQREWKLTDKDNILQKTTYSFDVSVWELFWPYFSGCRVSILDESFEKNPAEIVQAIKKFSITVLHFVPSMLKYFLNYVEMNKVNANLESLKFVFASGEALNSGHYHMFGNLLAVNETSLINLYGPTEAAVDVTYFVSDSYEVDTVLIGKPIDNIKILIMDRYMRLQPFGVMGELCIAGVGLAKGYINNEKQTADKFVNVEPDGLRVYKTGDVAILREDGNVEYIGRKDSQVKIRGFRIELEDIEVQLLAHPDIKEAVVIVEKDINSDNYLEAYYVSDQKLENKELTVYLLKLLPDYMIPLRFIRVDKMPVTQSGKIDRNVLKKIKKEEKIIPKRQFSDIQRRIAIIWNKLLEQEADINDNFFHVGGDSFKIMRLHSMMEKEFKTSFDLHILFQKTTISEQAMYLSGEDEEVTTKDEERKEDDSDKVAIIGMSGRFPKGDTIDDYWNNLINGVEGISVFTDELLFKAGIDSNIIKKDNYVKAKGILNNVEYFDEKFFGYSAKEAESMDPQLRLLHEYSWSTFEDAGYDPLVQKLPVGVYLSASGNYHWLKHLDNGNATDLFATMILNQIDFFGTRISYNLNLKGPSMTIQTACSSSLVALDKAYYDILNDKCYMALVGGVSVTYPCVSGYEYHEGMVFSPDGHCRPFDKDAKGTVPGNGIGMILLKRLSEAKRDGDNIYAVIRGSAVNNDGNAKVGYTAPSIEGQESVLKKAIQSAKVKAESIRYIETHGTATELGDMVEVTALKKVYGRSQGKICRIGSVKSNIGHLDAASGIAGFIKTALILKNGKIPATLHFNKPGDKLKIEGTGLVVNNELTDISCETDIYCAAVSSIGIGGSNAHVILEKYLNNIGEDSTNVIKEDKWNLLVISAKKMDSLDKMSKNLCTWIEKHKDTKLSDIAYTLQIGRHAFKYRSAIVCKDVEDALTKLRGFNNREMKTEHIYNEIEPQVVFVFSGIGSQYSGMGKGLYECEPYFRGLIDKCCDLVIREQGIDIKKYINAVDITDEMEEVLRLPSINQPLMFVLEYCLAKLLMHWGISPDMMIGYSFGEYTEACIAGVFELEAAIAIICRRGYLMQTITDGVMLSVPLRKNEVMKLITEDVYLAIDNGYSCIVSGNQESILGFEEVLRKNRCFFSKINTSNAMHSPYMQNIIKEYIQEFDKVVLQEPKIPFLSNLSGDWITKQDVMSVDYWIQHMTNTMNFASCMEKLSDSDNRIFIEIGPDQNTNTLLRYYVEADKNRFINLLRHPLENIDDQKFILNRLGQMWTYGKKVDWLNVFDNRKKQRISLPTYPFAMNYHSVEVKKDIVYKEDKIAEQAIDIQKTGERHDIYYPSWKRMLSVNEVKDAEVGERILVFIGKDIKSEKLKARLKKVYENITFVYTGNRFYSDKSSYTINPDNEEDYTLLWKSLNDLHNIPDKIIHAWTVVNHLDNMKDILATGYYSLLNIAKAIGWRTNVKIYVLAFGINEISGTEILEPASALLLGPCNVIPLEYNNIECSLLDIEDKESLENDEMIELMLRDIISGQCKGSIGYRGSYKWIPSLDKYERKSFTNQPELFENGKTFLITGGLGGIGLEIAKHITEYAKITLILIGRKQMPCKEQWQDILDDRIKTETTIKEKIKAIKHMEASGSKVILYALDVSKQDEVVKLKETLDADNVKVNCIIHAAGVADGMVIKNRKQSDSEKVMESKVYGTINLESCFNTGSLEFLILFSSISSTVPAFGQVAYCSANAYLNTFAFANKNRNNCNMISINWDTWKNVGMAVDNIKNYVKGMNSVAIDDMLKTAMDTVTGMNLFDRCISSGLTQPVISNMDYEQRIKIGNPSDMFLSGNRNAGNTNITAEYKPVATDIEKKIWSVISEYLGNNEIGVEDNFFDLGLKSLDMIRVSIKINELCGSNLVVTNMFQYPSIRMLSRFLSRDEIKAIENSTDRTKKILAGRHNMKNRIEAKGER